MHSAIGSTILDSIGTKQCGRSGWDGRCLVAKRWQLIAWDANPSLRRSHAQQSRSDDRCAAPTWHYPTGVRSLGEDARDPRYRPTLAAYLNEQRRSHRCSKQIVSPSLARHSLRYSLEEITCNRMPCWVDMQSAPPSLSIKSRLVAIYLGLALQAVTCRRFPTGYLAWL